MKYLLSHTLSGTVRSVLLRQRHGKSSGSASWDYCNLVNRVCLWKASCHYCMARLVISRQLALLLVYHSALLFRSCYNLGDCLFYFFHADCSAVSSGCKKRRLVKQVLYVRRCKARCSSCKHACINAVVKRFVLGVNLEDFLSALDIRYAYNNLSVKSARSEQRRV